MSLTGLPLLCLVIAATVAMFVGVIWAWPRLGSNGPRPVAGRAALLILVNAMVLLTAATQLNDRYLFFAGWQDLAGAMSSRPVTTTLSGGGVQTGPTGPTRTFSAPQLAALPALPGRLPADRVLTYQVAGARSGLHGRVVVQLPLGYSDPANRDVRYPVLETFSGYPGAPQQWIKVMNLGGEISAAATAGRMRPAIIISPQLEFPAGTDDECVNGPGNDPQVETWAGQDVPDWALRTLRVGLTRADWSTIGLSAGGWCAGLVAMQHPAQFAGAVVMGGYFEPDFGPLYEPFTPGSPAAARYDLVRAAGGKHPPAIRIWLETSQADRLSYRTSLGLIDHAREPLSVQGVVLRHAGHRLTVWQAYLPQALRWLGSAVPGFSPSAAVNPAPGTA